MNESKKTKQQLILELKELQARHDVSRQHPQKAAKRIQAEVTKRKRTEKVLENR